MLLKIIKEELEKANYVTEIFPSDNSTPFDRLISFLELEGKTNDDGQILELMMVPNVKDELNGFEILQYFVTFELDLSNCSDEQIEKISNKISEINYTLAIGSYGLKISEGPFIYFKYRQMISPTNDIRIDNQIGLTASVIHYQIENAYFIFEELIK